MRGIALVGLFLLVLAAAWAQAPATAPVTPGASDPVVTQTLTRGTQIAEAVSTITSTAVSPLLGVCILGVYEYYRTPVAQRASLPSYTKPYFWIPVGILLLLILGKDTIGGMAPLAKKPLDAIEVLLLNKASLFLIGLPVVIHEVAGLMGLHSLREIFAALEPVVYAQSGPSALERTGQGLLAFLLVSSGFFLTFLVWVVGHAFDVLVLLSPFPFVDLLLKGFRTLVFAVMATLTITAPKAGLILSIAIILICALLAGWSIRLLVYGAVFSRDLLGTILFSSYRRPAANEPLLGFTARKLQGVPRRAYVQVHRAASGGLELSYRPWLVGIERRVGLPSESGYDIGMGLFQPSLIETRERSASYTTMVRLLPRYRKSEQDLARILGVKGVRDIRFGGGLDSFWNWLKDDSVAMGTPS